MAKVRTPKRVSRPIKPQSRPRKGCPNCGARHWIRNTHFDAIDDVETIETPEVRKLLTQVCG